MRLKIRLEMLTSVVSWFPPRGVMENDREMMETMGGNDGLWLKIRLTEMLSSRMVGTPKNDQSLNACNFLNNGPIFNP